MKEFYDLHKKQRQCVHGVNTVKEENEEKKRKTPEKQGRE